MAVHYVEIVSDEIDTEVSGATVAYPQPGRATRGILAIVIQGGVEHGLWQR